MSELSEIQEEAVGQVRDAIGAFIVALVACREVGVEPSTALQATGIEIPGFATPMVNMQLGQMVDAALAAAAEQEAEEGLAS